MADQFTVAGMAAGQGTTDAASLTPFAGVVITNPVTNAYGTATVALPASANGTLSNPGIGTLGANGASYTVNGIPADIQAALPRPGVHPHGP
jgi:hypothetical protein